MLGLQFAHGTATPTTAERSAPTLRTRLPRLATLGLLAITLVSGPTVVSAQAFSRVPPLVIHSDRGGLLKTRLQQIKTLKATGRQIRITGRICYSTCTMLIGLPQTCVSPDTIFGFHGPSSHGRPLSPEKFDSASRMMAKDYPPALKSWFMNTARYEIKDVYKIRGSQLIAMGIQAC